MPSAQAEGRADPECQLHAATITVVFELFHDAIGRRAGEPGAFSAPLRIGHVAGFETKHQIPEGALFHIGREAGRLDGLFDVIDVDGETTGAAV